MSEQQSADGTVFVLKDPLTGEFFRFRETERFIARLLDGATPLETIRQRVSERFGARLLPETLAAFVGALDRAGLLESGETAKRERRRERRLQGNLLYLRFKLLDPDRLLNGLVDKVRFCFTPPFLLFSALMMLLAAGILAFVWSEAGEAFRSLLRPSSVPLFVAVVFLTTSAHEFAHGLTCKHFGGEVREMGFMLLYFQPALYCNVSDAWLFPEKSKRLWVGLAGPYLELFLWAVATALWRLTDVGTWVNQLAFIVMATSGIKTLFNFNPLIKLDGYSLLSDWLDIPNLRKKSFRHLGERIKEICGLDVEETKSVSERERGIYLAYGLAAMVVSFLFLGYAALKAGGFLIEHHQPLALMLFTGLLSTRVRRKLRKLFSRSPDPSDPADDGGVVESPDPAHRPAELESMPESPLPDRPGRQPAPAGDSPNGSGGVSEAQPAEGRTAASAALLVSGPPTGAGGAPAPLNPQTPAEEPKAAKKRSRRFRRWKRRIELVVLAALVTAILFVGRMELRIAGPFTVLPRENADVRAAVAGVVEEICVDEGDQVRTGDLIARLSDRDYRAEWQKVKAEIRQIQARIDLLKAGPTPEQIELAKAAVTKAGDKLKFAQARLARDQALFEQQLLSRNDFDTTRESVAMAENELTEARGKLQVLLEGARPEEIKAAQADLTRLEAHRLYLEEQLQLVNVTSPATGVITTPSRLLKERVRQMVQQGELIAKVHELDTVTVEAAVSEKEIADVKVGQTVAIKTRAHPDRVFLGTVIAIATTASGASASPAAGAGTATGASPPASAILVTTEIDNHEHLLKPGMTGMAKVYCGEHRLVDLVVRRLSRTFKVEFWSWW